MKLKNGDIMDYIVHIDGRILKRYETEIGAKRAMIRKWLKRYPNCELHDIETFNNEINTMVEVINLMSNKPVKIRKSELGGPCDPSTELYWSM